MYYIMFQRIMKPKLKLTCQRKTSHTIFLRTSFAGLIDTVLISYIYLFIDKNKSKILILEMKKNIYYVQFFRTLALCKCKYIIQNKHQYDVWQVVFTINI